MRIFLFKLFILTSILCLSKQVEAGFDSEIFTYDDPINAKGIHVRLSGETTTGKKWTARDMKIEDVPFMQRLFGDEKVMKTFGGGVPLKPEETKVRIENDWIPRFQNGHPHGGLLVLSDQNEPVGYVIGGKGDELGVAEIGGAGLESFGGQGYASSVLLKLVETWAPTVCRIGLGRDPVHSNPSIAEAFRCFGSIEVDSKDRILWRLDATASPQNPGSWKTLDKMGFKAASSKGETQIVFDAKDLSDDLMVQGLKGLFDSHRTTPLKTGTRYRMLDNKGNYRTFSYHERYQCLKYHFERIVEIE